MKRLLPYLILLIVAAGCGGGDNLNSSIISHPPLSIETIRIEAETELNDYNRIDSMSFELIDKKEKHHWFNQFSLILYSDTTYLFDFKFSGGYSAKETGPYIRKGDSLILISEGANTTRTFSFVETIEGSDFQFKDGDIFTGTGYLKVIRLNIDHNINNPK